MLLLHPVQCTSCYLSNSVDHQSPQYSMHNRQLQKLNLRSLCFLHWICHYSSKVFHTCMKHIAFSKENTSHVNIVYRPVKPEEWITTNCSVIITVFKTING